MHNTNFAGYSPVPDQEVGSGFVLVHDRTLATAWNKSGTARLHFSTEKAAVRAAARMYAEADRQAEANRYQAFLASLATQTEV